MVDFEDEEEFVDDELLDGPMTDDLDEDGSIDVELDSEDLQDDVESTETDAADVDDIDVVAEPAEEAPEDFGDDFDEAGVALPPTATFDGDDEAGTERVIEDDVDDSDDAVREGEFICRSCFMAKRESAIADEERMLCLDCV